MPPGLRIEAVENVMLQPAARPLAESCFPAAAGTGASTATEMPKSSPIRWSNHHATATCEAGRTQATNHQRSTAEPVQEKNREAHHVAELQGPRRPHLELPLPRHGPGADRR